MADYTCPECGTVFVVKDDDVEGEDSVRADCPGCDTELSINLWDGTVEPVDVEDFDDEDDEDYHDYDDDGD